MITSILIVTSLFLDGYLSFFLPVSSFVPIMPLCTLTSIVLCYPFIKKKYLFVFCIGCLYDLMYTNMLVLTGSIFIILYYLLSRINTITKIKILDDFIKLIIIIILYRVFFYFSICILLVKNINLIILVKNIACSFIFNIIYGLILVCILRNKSKKLKYN